MSSELLVSARHLHDLIQAGKCVVVDCRFDLTGPEKGHASWLAAHIPGAGYAHLDNDLAAPISPDSGRHPLPDASAFAEFLASLGWSPGTLLVAYDDGSNAIASRLWWLMRYFGQAAALLDGGLAAWVAAGLPLESGTIQQEPSEVTKLESDARMMVSSGQLHNDIDAGRLMVLDARSPQRFSGRMETLDSKGGHIPGALNRPLELNLTEDGKFKQPADLRSEFEAVLGGRDHSRVAHSCGSGVTACHNLFAMELAGLSGSLLYPGSWSEWIRDPARPIASGD
jgi:thiosulfate/3-mercaptopyruvate sulfurtransferase